MNMIMSFMKGALHYLVCGVLFAFFATGMDMITPKIVQYTVDGVLGEDMSTVPAFVQKLAANIGKFTALGSHLYIPAILLVLSSLCAVTFRYMYQVNVAKGGETFVKNMRDQLFDHLQHTRSSWNNEHPTGDLIQRCTNDVDSVKRFLSERLTELCSMMITITASLLGIFLTNRTLGIITFMGMPIIVGASFWFHQKISSGFLSCDENEGVLSNIAQENLTGVRVVRAFGQERSEQKKFEEQNRVVTEAWCKLGVSMCTYFGITDFIPGLMKVLVIGLGCYECVMGTMTVGKLLAVLSYFALFIRPIRMLGRVLSEMSKTSVSVKRLQEIMEAPVEPVIAVTGSGDEKICSNGNAGSDESGFSDGNAGSDETGFSDGNTDGGRNTDSDESCTGKDYETDTPPMNQDIRFDHVTFAYHPGKNVLEDVSFTIKAGETIGILGTTGSGKSTLMNLLDRFYILGEEGGSGHIYIGDRDINTINVDYLRKNIGYCLQEALLFSRNIEENIELGNPGATKEEIRAVSDAACLTSVVEGFNKGFETFVGERGVTLSGGQKQRAAIARTLIGRPQILIFDDSLSAVDTETDLKIRQNLKKYSKDTTVILISHRITTLMEADHILVLENGRLTDEGTHEELSARPGLYQKILKVQEGIARVEEEYLAGKEDADHE